MPGLLDNVANTQLAFELHELATYTTTQEFVKTWLPTAGLVQ